MKRTRTWIALALALCLALSLSACSPKQALKDAVVKAGDDAGLPRRERVR